MDPSSLPQRPARRNGNRLFLGLLLVVIGFLFLMEQIGNFSFQNWWALFILIPAFGSFSTAWYAFRRNSRVNEGVRAGLGGGLIIFTVAVMFLFNLDWRVWWPLMILVPGLVVLFNGFTLPGSIEENRPLSRRLYRPWSGWIGLGIIYLGAGLLVNNFNWANPETTIHNWWAIAILIPTVGGLVTQARLMAEGTSFNWSGISNFATTIVFGAVGLVAIFGIGWNLLTPIILIALGLVLIIGVIRR